MHSKKKSFAVVYTLTGQGKAVKHTPIRLDIPDEDKPTWIHLDLSDDRSLRWLKKYFKKNEWILENLTNPDICDPRLRVRQNQLLLVLRTVNRTPKSEPDDLVFLRLFARDNLLISTSATSAINFSELDDLFEDEDGPDTIAALIPTILENTLDSVTDSINAIEDQIDDLEETIIIGSPPEGSYQSLSELLRQVIVIRRFMLPEREALDNLIRHGTHWFHGETERFMRDNFDRIRRIVEDIDLLEKRMRINQDALSHIEDKQTQRNTYMLSVIAGIFLPLSFLASVFGMNLGGIPLDSSPYGFIAVNLVMVCIGLLIWFIFKRLRWI